MSGEITKVEIQAMIEVHAKSVEQLSTIANNLATISSQQEKICSRLYNGLGRDISESVARVINDNEKAKQKALEEFSGLAKSIQKDVGFLKWIYGGLFALIGLALLIIQVTERVLGK